MGYQALDLEWILYDFYIERQVFLQGARSITARWENVLDNEIYSKSSSKTPKKDIIHIGHKFSPGNRHYNVCVSQKKLTLANERKV